MNYNKEIKEKLTLTERAKQHQLRHPNDKNIRKENKGVIWGNITKKDKALDVFYKNHIYTFVDENDLSKKRWVQVAGFEGEEE